MADEPNREETPPPTETVAEEDSFEDVFDQLSKANDEAREAALRGEEPPKAVAAEELPPDDAQVAEAARLEAEAARTATSTPTPQPTPTPLADDEIARIARIAAQVNAPPRQEPQPEPERPLFSRADVEFLTAYQNEYRDVARAEELLRKRDILQAVQWTLSQVSKAYDGKLALVDQIAARIHLGDIQTLAPDYGKITRDQALAWIKQQPDYLQPAYEYVVQKGSPQQVAHLTEQIRGSASAPGAVAATRAPAADAAPPVGQTPAQKKALASLANPSTAKRSGISANILEPATFEDAFDMYSRQQEEAARAGVRR